MFIYDCDENTLNLFALIYDGTGTPSIFHNFDQFSSLIFLISFMNLAFGFKNLVFFNSLLHNMMQYTSTTSKIHFFLLVKDLLVYDLIIYYYL